MDRRTTKIEIEAKMGLKTEIEIAEPIHWKHNKMSYAEGKAVSNRGVHIVGFTGFLKGKYGFFFFFNFEGFEVNV